MLFGFQAGITILTWPVLYNIMKRIDISTPEKFQASLQERAAGISDADFKHYEAASVRWGSFDVCVSVARKNGIVAVRNSNDPEKKTVLFTNMEWKAFVKGVKADAFNV